MITAEWILRNHLTPTPYFTDEETEGHIHGGLGTCVRSLIACLRGVRICLAAPETHVTIPPHCAAGALALGHDSK